MKIRLIGAVLVFSFSGCVCTMVDTGNRGVKTRFGKVDPTALTEGFQWVSPLESVHDVSIRQRKEEASAPCYSSDLQQINAKLAILYRTPEAAVVRIFRDYQGDPFPTLIAPRAQEALKEVTATMTAEQIVKSRETVKKHALDLTRQKVGELLVIEDLVIENLDLSPDLEHAIEAKMVQEQEAAKARFIQQKASIEADTQVIRAKGEAAALRIQGEALRENPKVIDMRLIEKWDGKAPLVTGGGAGPSIILPLSTVTK